MWEQLEEQQRTANPDPAKSKKESSKLEVGKAEGAAETVETGGDPEAEAVDQGAAMRSQINLFWGNVLFEHSQVEVRPNLEAGLYACRILLFAGLTDLAFACVAVSTWVTVLERTSRWSC